MEKKLKILKENLKPTYTKKQRQLFFIGSVLSFFLFIIFTLIVRADILRQFDFNTTVRLQDDIPTKFDNFFSILSVIGRFEISLIILVIILVLRRKILGLFVIGFFGFAHVLELVGKLILEQPGPPHMFLRTTDLSHDFPGLYVHTQSSYPSGHSMRAVILTVLIVMIIYHAKKLNSKARIILIGISTSYAFLMLLSRVSLGEHWTTDVVGGSFLGLSIGLLSLILL